MIHEIFAQAAQQYPTKKALRYENDSALSYQELDRRSNQMARLLTTQGLTVGSHVIVQMERGIDQVIVFLALSKIGGVYIPLSLTQPSIRLHQMIQDCQPALVLSTPTAYPDTEKAMKSLSPVKMLILDQKMRKMLDAMPAIVEGIKLTEDNLLYIAYSSGSSGKPKGIPIRHVGITAYWLETLKVRITTPIQRVSANVAIDFDAHIMEYIMAWVFGACLHLTSERTRTDAKVLARFLVDHEISDVLITPPVLRLFTPEQLSKMKKKGLQAFHTTGEACTTDIIERCDQAGVVVYNCYGPTEATFGVTMVHCQLKDFYQGLAPIGLPRPESEVKLVVVDSDQNPVPAGQSGELVIVSPYLTPGYLNRPAEAARFFMMQTEQGEKRAYRTGDRFVLQGEYLFFQGRLSAVSHFKIRGQFVDPTGTEKLLRTHNDIKDLALLLPEDNKPFVAFIVTESNQSIRPANIRDYLKRQGLKPAEIPSFFHTLPALPLNSSGKVDRHQLRQIPIETSLSEPDLFKKPASAMEEKILALWSDLLNDDPSIKLNISTLDPFALLGGDSMQAMKLASLLENAFDVPVAVKDMGDLEQLTIQHLAGVVFNNHCLAQADALCQQLNRGNPSLAPVFFIPPITGEGQLTYAKLCEQIKTERPIYAINSPTLRDAGIVGRKITEIARAYITLARKIQPYGPLSLIGWSSGGTVVFEMGCQLETMGTRAADLLIIDTPAPQVITHKDKTAFANDLIEIMQHFAKQWQQDLQLDQPEKAIDQLAELDQEAQIDRMLSQALLASLDDALANLLLRVHFFLKAGLHYYPSTLKKSRLNIFYTEPTQIAASAHLTDDSTTQASLGWSQCSAVAPAMSLLPGDHFSIITGYHQERLASILSAMIEMDTPRLLSGGSMGASESKIMQAFKEQKEQQETLKMAFKEQQGALKEQGQLLRVIVNRISESEPEPVENHVSQPPSSAVMNHPDAIISSWNPFPTLSQRYLFPLGLLSLVSILPILMHMSSSPQAATPWLMSACSGLLIIGISAILLSQKQSNRASSCCPRHNSDVSMLAPKASPQTPVLSQALQAKADVNTSNTPLPHEQNNMSTEQKGKTTDDGVASHHPG